MHILYSVQTRTHPGKVRANNQDDFGTILEWRERLGLTNADLQARGHLFAVADGMGGHAAGEVASRLAIDALFREYYTAPWRDPKANLIAAIAAANQRIFSQAATNAEMSGMGTTLVAALYLPEQWLIANVGDSRAYLFRNGRIKQVTQDHSWVAEQARSGILSAEEAAHHPLRNVITRSLGNEERVQPDIYELNARPEDILLLCSDGLSNLVSEKDMTGILKSYPLDDAAEKLLALALERGAPDNVTLVLVQLVGGKQRRSRSVLPWLALAATLIAIGGFVFWNYTDLFKPAMQSTPGRPLAPTIATFTPLPKTPMVSPTGGSAATVTPTLPLAPQEGNGTPQVGASIAQSPLPTPEARILADPVVIAPIAEIESAVDQMVFVEGPVRVRSGGGMADMELVHYGLAQSAPFTYTTAISMTVLGTTWSDRALVIVGDPTPAPDHAGMFVSRPTLLIPVERDAAIFTLLWSQLNNAAFKTGTTVLMYSVNGAGGGVSLGIDVPSGAEGTPIAVLGHWLKLPSEDFVQFIPEQIFDYIPSEGKYRLRDEVP